MTVINNRRHQRLAHRAKIRFFPSPNVGITLEMRDFSDSGLYLFCTDTSSIKLGDTVEVQTSEIDDAPILASKVIRIEDNVGFALEFM